MDSAFYSAATCHAIRRAGAFFSVTAKMDPAVKTAIAAMPEEAWTPIQYPHAVWDDQLGRWVSDAEVAETGYTAFASKKGKAITARLIVRRVRDLNPGGHQRPGRPAAQARQAATARRSARCAASAATPRRPCRTGPGTSRTRRTRPHAD
jgi:hypothetical protein